MRVDDTNCMPDGGEAPTMFDFPVDQPPVFASIRSGVEVSRIHSQWRLLSSNQDSQLVSPWARVLRKVRSWVNRVLGRTEHEFLADLIRAIDVLAARSDEISDQLGRQQHLLENVARILGEEVTHLRAKAADTLNSRDS
jgi:hypothetical protein